MEQEHLSGFLLITKPENISSYDCIRSLKKYFPKKTKIGHAGTLDPFASGLLIIAIGRQATRHLSHFQELPKRYEATVKLGLLTTTLDKTGTVISQTEVPQFSEKTLKEAAARFMGGYVQTPPAYSALKHQGTSLYEYARRKTLSASAIEAILESKKRFVSIYDLEITRYEHPFFSFSATVSKGTYIRSLGNDIALSLGFPGTTIALKRTTIGAYSVENALLISPQTKDFEVYQSLFQIDPIKK